MSEIGSFVVGEIPVPLTYQFLDSAGTAIDLSGFTATFQWGRRGTSTPYTNTTTVAATIPTPLSGIAQHNWSGSEFAAPGRWVGRFVVENGTNRFASILIEWTVCQAVDP